MTTKAALAAIALTASMFAPQAQALDVYTLDNLIDANTDAFTHAFADPGAFTDHYTFTTDDSAYLTDALVHSTKSELTINFFGLYLASNNSLVAPAAIEVDPSDSSVAQPGSGYWRFAGVSIAANTAYYLAIDGNVLATNGSSYGGSVLITPVPEPETYGMLLGGMGIMAFLARRRKSAQA
ncbi:FxDxF family PEP-CTERM protein [Rugamonas sp. CCM 8940]|uniref:FxDxF family PEP-CTERM protein n=1 Tax=Rugamonas sp. CCM 8940 TaxID=2765359 RepID=UPI0018F46BB8|nr:FxDxF family PEP-CTERM protein [Rugamonas sp. CCM 8940]MBJ7310618.1 FxDxF family PEP-CTERM protein [Rugamonas sp. CCM 8940]